MAEAQSQIHSLGEQLVALAAHGGMDDQPIEQRPRNPRLSVDGSESVSSSLPVRRLRPVEGPGAEKEGEDVWEDAPERQWGDPPRKVLGEKPLAEKSTNLPAEKRGAGYPGEDPGDQPGNDAWQGMMWGKPHRAQGGKDHVAPYPSPGYAPESPATVLPRRQLLRDLTKKGGEKGPDGETPQMFTRRMARARGEKGADMANVSLGKFLAKATSPANSPTKPGQTAK